MATVDEILTRQAYAAGDETWTKDNNYPSYTMYAEPEYVPVTNKRIADFNDQISVRGEQNAQFVGFQLPRYDDALDLSTQKLYIHYQTAEGGSDCVPCNVSKSDNYIRLCWKIPAQATQEPGSIQMMVYATGTDSVGDRTVWKTLPATYTIHDGLEIGGGIPEPEPGTEDTEAVNRLKSIMNVHQNFPSNIGNEEYGEAVVTFVDDDGHIDFYNNFVPVFRKHGLYCSFAVVASRAETPIGTTTSGDPYEAMDWEQCRELVGEGFDLQSHTYSHNKNVFSGSATNCTDAGLESEYGKADKLFRQNGLDYNCIVYPWGNAESLKRIVAKRYTKYGLTLITGENGLNDEITDPMLISRYYVQEGTQSISAVKRLIDTAITNKSWLIICTHANANQPSVSGLDDLLTYCETVKVRVETLTKAARIKAPVYQAGHGDSMFRIMPDGSARMMKLDDVSIERIFARAADLGLLTKTKSHITAVYKKDFCVMGELLDRSLLEVTLHYMDQTSRITTDYTISESDLTFAQGENVFTIVYEDMTCTVSIMAHESADDQLQITAQPADVTATVCTNAAFSLAATGKDLTYQWYYRRSSSSAVWSSIDGATSSTLSIDALGCRNGRQYKCVVIDAYGDSLESDVATMTVDNPASEYYDFGGKIAYVPLSGITENSTILIGLEGFSNPYKEIEDGRAMITSKAANNTAGTCGAYFAPNAEKTFFTMAMNLTPAVQQSNVPRSSAKLAAGVSVMASYPLKLLMCKGVYKSSYDEIVDVATLAATGTLQKNSGYLYINTSDGASATTYNPDHYTTGQALTNAIASGEQYYNYDILKISMLKVWAGTKYTTIAEALKSAVTPDIDIQIGDDGLPYNAGTSGKLVCSL